MRSIYDTYNHYDVEFYDDTILTLVTDIPYVVDEWIDEIEHIYRHDLHHLIVGLDVEWRPNTSKDVQNPVATLQLCVGRRCLVFQLIHSPYDDVLKLYNDYNLCVRNIADLRGLAAQEYNAFELYNVGLKDLARRVLEKEIYKPRRIAMSRWDDEWLSPAQVQYACLDAVLSFIIGRILIVGDY